MKILKLVFSSCLVILCLIALIWYGNSTQPGHQKAAPTPATSDTSPASDRYEVLQGAIAAANAGAEREKLLQSPRVQKRTDKTFKEYPEWGEKLALQLAEGQTWVGMDIFMLVESQGHASHVSESDIGGRKSYTFIYESESGNSYFYLEETENNAVVTAIQKSN
jgi:hypothetical protein